MLCNSIVIAKSVEISICLRKRRYDMRLQLPHAWRGRVVAQERKDQQDIRQIYQLGIQWYVAYARRRSYYLRVALVGGLKYPLICT